jgi:hypothetical protein
VRLGNCENFPENSQSVIEIMALLNISVALTATGASGDPAGSIDDDPMCILMTVFVSSHAARNGSHSPL